MPPVIQEAIRVLADRRDLTSDLMRQALTEVMTGTATQAQIGALLMGLRVKGETVDELVAAAQVMRDLLVPVRIRDTSRLIDTCGTGGDGASTFNISTASAIVAACAGAKVAKHGNRSVSSRSGSADVLEAAGVALDLSPARIAQCIETVGIGFLFAPRHHEAMRHASGARKELAVRTLFNMLGPLTNPAGARRQVVGVFSMHLLDVFAQALKVLGSECALVVRSTDGLDEISPAAPTEVAELRNGGICRYRITPQDFGLPAGSIDELRVDSAAESLAVLHAVFAGAANTAATAVILNGAAAIYAAGLADDWRAAVARARTILASGMAAAKLAELVAFTGAAA